MHRPVFVKVEWYLGSNLTDFSEATPDPCRKKRTDDINISYSLRKDQWLEGHRALSGSRLFAIAVAAGKPGRRGR